MWLARGQRWRRGWAVGGASASKDQPLAGSLSRSGFGNIVTIPSHLAAVRFRPPNSKQQSDAARSGWADGACQGSPRVALCLVTGLAGAKSACCIRGAGAEFAVHSLGKPGCAFCAFAIAVAQWVVRQHSAVGGTPIRDRLLRALVQLRSISIFAAFASELHISSVLRTYTHP